jgi:Peptidase family M28
LDSVDYSELMKILSRPRPTGSPAEKQALLELEAWLERRGIPYKLHEFKLFPNFWLGIGLWLILSRTLLAVLIWQRSGWLVFAVAMLGLLGGLVDVALNIPLVTWFGAKRGQNLLIEFDSPTAHKEIICSAHHDTKTELLDHRQRMFFIRSLPFGIFLTLALGLLGPLDQTLRANHSPTAAWTYGLGVMLSLPLLFLAWGLGLNLTLGRFRPPSQGAVDNGAACAILLGLAQCVQSGALPLTQTDLTLALFAGEEVNMQGSRAYVRSREWSLPARALNLEVMGQDGEYVHWEQDGYSLKLWPCDRKVNQDISQAVQQVTGSAPRPVGPLNSDGGSFLRSGIPASTIGTYDRQQKDRGFHSASDNLERIVMERLPEAVEILSRFILISDSSSADGKFIHEMG